MVPDELSNGWLTSFSVTERICSALSLIGCAFIAITFSFSKAFHKPINRMVFWASMGNVFTNVATLMSRSTLSNTKSGWCQLQGFLIQMFMPADAYWTLAMALNVYLTFYWKYDAADIRNLEKYYILACYGLPFIPAVTYLFIDTQKSGPMYGNATIWCWISNGWDVMRIATFYGPVWVCIFFTTIIYTRTGRMIYIKRKQLRSFTSPVPNAVLSRNPTRSTKTTEVSVTSEPAARNSIANINAFDQVLRSCPFSRNAPTSLAGYTVSITGPHSIIQNKGRPSNAKTPLPSSHGMTSPTAICSVKMSNSRRVTTCPSRPTNPTDSAAWAYSKVAVLFFIAMMVTWIPSSANRVYSVVHPGKVSLTLEFASAFVLPLQGFWNAVIYTTTSLPACKHFWRKLRGHNQGSGIELTQMSGAFPARPVARPSQADFSSDLLTETDSIGQTLSRPGTKDSTY